MRRQNNMNTRANIMYFIEHFLEMAQKDGHVDYVRMIQRDIIRVVDAVAPDDGSGAANVKVVRRVCSPISPPPSHRPCHSLTRRRSSKASNPRVFSSHRPLTRSTMFSKNARPPIWTPSCPRLSTARSLHLATCPRHRRSRNPAAATARLRNASTGSRSSSASKRTASAIKGCGRAYGPSPPRRRTRRCGKCGRRRATLAMMISSWRRRRRRNGKGASWIVVRIDRTRQRGGEMGTRPTSTDWGW